jgi:trehalose 6-phosphate phosphatase
MQTLFSKAGKKRLEEIGVPGLLCAFDFDGTLAPIVAIPEQARLPDEIRHRLAALAQLAPVAIITGRSVQDIRARLGFTPDFIIGNHGLEGLPGWEKRAARHEDLSTGWRKQLTGALLEHADDPGIHLEDKRYSLSVHYRLARNPDHAANRLQDLFHRLDPRPRIVSGKYVYNLVAEDAWHKGSALERLMQLCHSRNAIYVGDDVTDEDVFRLRRPDILTVRIERGVDSAADFFLPHADDILPLIEELTERLRKAGARNWMQAEAAAADEAGKTDINNGADQA